ncbi:MAG: hypothetical protein U0625_11870 [Phycisphaerales bacterium]
MSASTPIAAGAAALAGRRVVVLGATSPVGRRIDELARAAGARVVGVARSPAPRGGDWLRADLAQPGALAPLQLGRGDLVISAAPLRTVARALGAGIPEGVELAAMSSASATTKAASPFARDANWAREMIAAEDRLRAAAPGRVRILRPTMIYGSGRDRNIARLARTLARMRLFPMVGGGSGLRAPVHFEDLAAVVVAAAAAPARAEPIHVPGGERLPYRAMVERIAQAMGVRFVAVPLPAGAFRAAGRALSGAGDAGWLMAVCARMAEDLVVPDDAAALNIPRRGFHPDARALGRAEVSP